ncbi:probable inactive peptidyl-prolyl cis-trans isomerase-like 6 isoform X3 [Ornithorhynchus anatinus]|uniref:probable inactive peptidyl-prolyl cis-trans isomerase-like 6 isoform X3 n=1 Tax=Ornithorhynchus anatinus TaxID=9258 RepID=UPI0019D42382|nr:probable inactive peptidyl-prolyl cis-trans isomerase-like 6 isoform X3 [Ornithorhynchus anatinus]
MAAAAAAAGGPPPHRLEVAGLLKAPAFHVAKKAAESLKKSFPTKFAEPIILPLMEFAWNEYLQEKKKELRGEMWAYPARVMCFTDGQLLGDEDALLAWSSEKWDYKDPKPKAFYEAVASDFCINYLQNPKHDFAYLDIAIQDEAIGRLVFELFSSECPKTCTNFQTLCTGSAGISPSGVRLHYKDSAFHRLVKNGWLQGGDITSGKGDGGESIYGPTFEGN